MAKDTRIFKASEIEYGRRGWIVDLSPAHIVSPDHYWRFPTRSQARLFAALHDAGMDNREAEYRASQLSATRATAALRALTDAAEDEAAYTVALDGDGDGGHQTPAGASGMAYAAGSEIVVFKTAGGWMSCIQGVDPGGIAYETDDFGPFGTAAEAEEYARDYAAAYNEE